MQRNLIIVGAGALVVLVLVLGGYFAFRANGDDVALAQLDRLVQTYDGEYQNAGYDTATDRLVVEGLVLRNYMTDPEAEPLDLIEVGHLDITGLARFSLHDALSASRSQRLFSAFDATGITLTESGQAISIEEVSLRDVSFDGGAMGSVNGLEQRQVMARLALLLNAAEARITGFMSPAQGPTGMTIGELSIDKMRGGSVDRIEATNLSLWDNGQMGTVGDTVRLDAEHFSLEGLDAHVPLERIAAGERVSFDRQSNVPLYGEFEVSGLTIRQESGEPLTIGSLSIANEAYEGPMPTQTAMAMTGFRLPLDGEFVDAADSASLRNLGYDELVLSFLYNANYDFETQEYGLSNISVGIEDMGELRMQMQISGVPFTEDMIDQSAERLLADGFIAALLESAALKSGTLSFTDEGLFARVVASNAREAGQSPEEYVQATIAELEAERQDIASSELAVQTIDALIAFFEEPGALTVTFAPETPVPVQQMAVAAQINPLILVELLNVQVTANN